MITASNGKMQCFDKGDAVYIKVALQRKKTAVVFFNRIRYKFGKAEVKKLFRVSVLRIVAVQNGANQGCVPSFTSG